MAIKGESDTVITCYEWTYLAWHGWRWRPEIRVIKSRLRHPEMKSIYFNTLKSQVPLNKLLSYYTFIKASRDQRGVNDAKVYNCLNIQDKLCRQSRE